METANRQSAVTIGRVEGNGRRARDAPSPRPSPPRRGRGGTMGPPVGAWFVPAAAAASAGAIEKVIAQKGGRQFSLSPSEGERAAVRGNRTVELIVRIGRPPVYFGFRANSRSWEMWPAKRTLILDRTSSGTSAQSYLFCSGRMTCFRPERAAART